MTEKIQNLVAEIERLTNEFNAEANSNIKGNKAAGRRARKISGTLTKLFKEYRTLTVESEKTKMAE